MELLPNEQMASDLVERIGLDRAYRLLDKITNRFDRRYKRVCDASFNPIDRGAVRVTPIELELTFILKLGIGINDTYNTPAAAAARVKARLEERKAKRLAKRQQNQSALSH